jgi:hypothetical protein
MKVILFILLILTLGGCQKEWVNPDVAEWTITYQDGTREVYQAKIDPTNDLIMDVNNCLTFKYDLSPIRCNVKSYIRSK